MGLPETTAVHRRPESLPNMFQLNSPMACRRMLHGLSANFTGWQWPVPDWSCMPGHWAQWQESDAFHVAASGTVAFLSDPLGRTVTGQHVARAWRPCQLPLSKCSPLPTTPPPLPNHTHASLRPVSAWGYHCVAWHSFLLSSGLQLAKTSSPTTFTSSCNSHVSHYELLWILSPVFFNSTILIILYSNLWHL